MGEDHWRPRCRPATGLVTPVRLDSTGRTGPTRNQAAGGRWRQTTYGLHVPADTDSTGVEQRILEQSMRLDGQGAVTGWAALRMYCAAFFDGLAPDGVTRLPVALVSPRQLASTADSTASRAGILGEAILVLQGVPCVPVERAVVDEIRRLDDLREGAVVIDMASAARLTSIRRMRAYADRLSRRRRSLVLAALDLADENSRSPMESRMRLTWVIDAGLPRPMCNRVVYALDGTVLGCPDLLDVDLGVVGEYDGADHRSRDRHRRDTDRLEKFLAHGLEFFNVVAGDSREVQVRRMHAARARALSRVAEPRRWTIDPPLGAWRPFEQGLDEELDFRDLMEGD